MYYCCISVCCKQTLLVYFGILTSNKGNRATGYVSQHVWCLSQARIK